MRTIALAFGLLVATTLGAAAQSGQSAASPGQAAPAPDPREAGQRIGALPWAPVRQLRLPQSKATLDEMKDFVGVAGADSQAYRALVEGHDDPAIEGAIVRRDNGSELVFSWHAVGYVDAKDFADIDADKLIESVRDATFAHNDVAVHAGNRPFTAVDWLRRPTWNDSLHTAYWMMQGVHDDGTRTVNAIALKLGRRGYEKMIWVTSPDETARANDLTLAQDAFKYPSGDRYEDHATGDKVAAYGIAGLVAGVIGLKAAKILGIGAFLLAFKKFCLLLLVPVFWVWNKIKALLGKREAGDA